MQAGRHAADDTVGRKTLQAFVGALHGRHAERGIHIATSRLSSGATDRARGITSRVVLVDGDRLAKLMIRQGVGVRTRHTYRVVQLDEDFSE